MLRFAGTLVIFRDPSAQAHETPFVASQGTASREPSPLRSDACSWLCARRCSRRDGPVAATPSNQEIADSIDISVESVRSHMKTLFRDFEVPALPQYRKRTELARRALNAGVITPRDEGPSPDWVRDFTPLGLVLRRPPRDRCVASTQSLCSAGDRPREMGI